MTFSPKICYNLSLRTFSHFHRTGSTHTHTHTHTHAHTHARTHTLPLTPYVSSVLCVPVLLAPPVVAPVLFLNPAPESLPVSQHLLTRCASWPMTGRPKYRSHGSSGAVRGAFNGATHVMDGRRTTVKGNFTMRRQSSCFDAQNHRLVRFNDATTRQHSVKRDLR